MPAKARGSDPLLGCLYVVLQSQKGITEYVKFLHEYPEILQPNGAVNDMMLAMLFGAAPGVALLLFGDRCHLSTYRKHHHVDLLDPVSLVAPAEGLASAEDPMPMILLLEALDVLGRELPIEIRKPDSAGLTFISRFISVNFMTIYETEAEKRVAQDTWEEPTIREVSPSALR